MNNWRFLLVVLGWLAPCSAFQPVLRSARAATAVRAEIATTGSSSSVDIKSMPGVTNPGTRTRGGLAAPCRSPPQPRRSPPPPTAAAPGPSPPSPRLLYHHRCATTLATTAPAAAPTHHAHHAPPPVGFFDPFGICDDVDPQIIYWLRAAELKHGRVTMLATTGWLVNTGGTFWPGTFDGEHTWYASFCRHSSLSLSLS